MTTTLKEAAKLWIDGVNDADAPDLAPLIEAWEKCADDLTLCEFAESVLCES